MSGIVFFRTEDLPGLNEFYQNRIGADLWKDQGGCLIFDKNGFKFAFCKTDEEPDTCGVITFLYDAIDGVDEIYSQLEDIAFPNPFPESRNSISTNSTLRTPKEGLWNSSVF